MNLLEMSDINTPMKLKLESHGETYSWEGNWDSDFLKLFNVFLGLCSIATYGDISKLKEVVYDSIQEEKESLEEYERRKQECPAMFKN